MKSAHLLFHYPRMKISGETIVALLTKIWLAAGLKKSPDKKTQKNVDILKKDIKYLF
jgi:hypothetical protein